MTDGANIEQAKTKQGGVKTLMGQKTYRDDNYV